MVFKGIDIVYDIAEIPNLVRNKKRHPQAVEFRDEAMALIDAALMAAGVGELTGTEVQKKVVNIGFDVEDFDAAETVILDAIAGTRFENFRDIARSTFDIEEMNAAA